MTFLGSVLGGIGKLKVVWKSWNIRTFIVASFSFQLFLILFAPFRKRSSNLALIALTWLAYLLADWVAAQAVGLITRATEVSDSQSELYSFWAQFLLLHLGGPDTITALALEDNALWLRTGLHLGTQVYSTLGILTRSIRLSDLWAPMVLMFVAGIIKYGERIMSLFHGRLMDIDTDPIPHAQELVEDLAIGELSQIEMVRGSVNLFHSYKRLYVDHKLNPDVRTAARMYFWQRSSEEAYRILEVQLNCMYEAMYTKASISHNTTWKVLRHIVLLLELTSLVIWSLFIRNNPHKYSHQDIRITDALVIGAVVVDALALLRIQTSDWSIARINNNNSIKTWIYNKVLNLRQPPLSCTHGPLTKTWSFFRRLFLARWSESIKQFHSEVKPGFSKHTKHVIHFLQLEHFVIRRYYLRNKSFSSGLWDFIYDVLTKPQVSREYNIVATGETIGIYTLLRRALPLHILDYDDIFDKHSDSEFLDPQSQRTDDNPDVHRCREICHTIERYISYLYYYRPDMMFAAAGKQNVLNLNHDILGAGRGDGVAFLWWPDDDIDLETRSSFGMFPSELELDKNEEREIARRQMDEVIEFLGKDLVDEKEKGFLLAVVWTHLLCHTAIACRANVHAQHLKEGGELLSFVWLLMVHLGLGKASLAQPL